MGKLYCLGGIDTGMTHSNEDPSVVKKSTPKLLVINQYYKPDLASSGLLLADLCEGLVQNGFEVDVITGQPSYASSTKNALDDEIVKGVAIHRVGVGGVKGREKLIARLASYLIFIWRAYFAARKIAGSKSPEHVLTLSNPPIVGLLGALIARKYKAKFTYVLYDVYPDLLVETGWLKIKWPIVPVWNSITKWILSQSTITAVPGERMRRALIQNKSVDPNSIVTVPNWAKPEMELIGRSNKWRKKLGVENGRLLILYAGNIGVMHPITELLDGIERVPEAEALFVFVGDGTKRGYLIDEVKRRSVSNVAVMSYLAEKDFTQLVYDADCCIVALNAGLEKHSVPSRAYTFMSAGKPIVTLMSGDADISELVAQENCGWNSSDAQGFADVVSEMTASPKLIEIKGNNARNAYERNFTKDAAIKRYARVLRGD